MASEDDQPKATIVMLPISEELKQRGVESICFMGSALQIRCQNKTFTTTLYKDDPIKTFKAFDTMLNGSLDHSLKEDIHDCISDNWLKVIYTIDDVHITNLLTQQAAGALIDLALGKSNSLFKDQHGTAYASVSMGDHSEVIAVDSGKFRRLIAKLFYDKFDKKVPSSDAISNAIQMLQAKAEYESQTVHLSLRVANNLDGSIYYDLTDEKHRSIRITKDDWAIIQNTPVLFARYNQTPQVEPYREYDSDVFDQFIKLTNVEEDDDILLLKVYIVSLFIPEIAHVILLSHGEKGSAKSTLQKLIKLLVDPSKPVLLTVHNDRNEFIQQCWQNYVVYYDNLKRTPEWLSDEACKAVTGVGSSKRKLFTDSETIVYEYKRCLGFNGINVILTEPDALDRSLMIEQIRIPKEARRLESQIYQKFESIRSPLLGYIFDTVVKAIRIRESLELKDLPRMADFAIWGEAIARAMDYGDLQFLNAYYDNIGKQNTEAIELNPLGQAIVKLCETRDEFYGSITECLTELNSIASVNRINNEARAWPKSSTWVSRFLKRIRSNLLEGPRIEIEISNLTSDLTIENKEHKKNTSMIRIRKIASLDSLDSRNHEGKEAKEAS